MARRECFAGFGAPLTSKSGRILLAVVLAGGSAFAGPIHPVAAVAVGSQSQTITFTPPYDGVVGTSLDLQASATSGLVVTFALAPTSACSLNGGTLSFVSAGSCDVTASQPGNSTWAAAPSVTQAIDAAPAYEVSWLVTPPDSSTRAAGTIEVGDRLAIEIAAADDTAVTACSIRITSAGGWVMDTSGDLTGGKCSLWFTLPDYTYPGDRANFGRVDDDLCVSILSLTFADSQPRAMDPADREAPGGVACYNGSDRSDREDRVLDFQVVDGGTPQPFASSPAMLSWNPNDWVGYTPLQFGQTTHLELPDIGAVYCTIYLNGDWDTVIQPASPDGCSSWDVRLPGVLPSTFPDGGVPGNWSVEVAVSYRTAAGWGGAIGYVNMIYAPSDGVFESSQPAIFPTDLATTRFVTVGEEWTPEFKVSGATPTTCRLDKLTVSPGPVVTDEWHDATAIDPDGTCHFDLPPLTSVYESHQFYVYADTEAGQVTFGGTINAIPVPTPPTISTTASGGSTNISVTAGAGEGLLMNMTVTAGATGSAQSATATANALPGIASSCVGSSVGDTKTGGGLSKITKSCSLAPGTYTATAKMYDVEGNITMSVKTFTVVASPVVRYAGTDIFASAAAASAHTFGSPCHCTAYIAYAYNFPDALAGAAAAGKVHGPVLFAATTGALNAATAAELTRLAPDHIVVLGSSVVISDAVMSAIAAYAPAGQTVRYAGPDRYATAAAVSAATYPAACGCTVYIAYSKNYPDALAGAAAAGKVPGPILLVNVTGAIDASTATELRRLKPANIVVLGSSAVISSAVYNALASYVPKGHIGRYYGADRYATAASISAHTYPAACGCTVYIASGKDYNDALAAAAAAGTLNGPLLLVYSSGSLPGATITELKRLKPAHIVVVGNTSVVSDGIYNLLAAYVS